MKKTLIVVQKSFDRTAELRIIQIRSKENSHHKLASIRPGPAGSSKTGGTQRYRNHNEVLRNLPCPLSLNGHGKPILHEVARGYGAVDAKVAVGRNGPKIKNTNLTICRSKQQAKIKLLWH